MKAPFQNSRVARSDSSMDDIFSYYGETRNNLMRLPVPSDDLSAELGVDIYRQMMTDTQVSSSITTFVSQILSRGVEVMPSHPDTSSPQNKKSVEIADFIKRVISNVGSGEDKDTSYVDALEDHLRRRFQFGCGITEMEYSVPKKGKLKDKAVLSRLRTVEPETAKFIVDKRSKVKFMLSYTGKSKPPNPKSEKIEDFFEAGWEAITYKKFFHTVNHMDCGDPRGQSILRSVYSPWYLLQNIYPEYHKYLVQFASGIIKATMAEDSIVTVDKDGNEVDPMDTMELSVQRLSNGTYIVLDHGNDVEIIRPDGNGDAFRLAVDMLGNQIVKGIMGSILATSTSGSQTRSASSVHKNVSDIVILTMKESLSEAQRSQIWKPLVELNFGYEAAEELTPYASMGRITKEDRASMMSSCAAAGLTLTPSQQQWMCLDLEIPKATKEEMDVLYENLKIGKEESAAAVIKSRGNNKIRQDQRNKKEEQNRE